MTILRMSVSQQIREYLLDRIARGQLRAGDRIVEARVASDMKVSSIPVREAIRELVAMGILQSSPHRGAWVREVSLQETIQAFEVRSALEPLAVESAASRLRQHCRALRRAVQQIVRSARHGDFASFQHHNQVFHRSIVEAAGNPVLLRVWDSLAFDVRTRFTMDYLTTADPVAIAREHEPIVDALERGAAAKAASLLRSHSRGLVEYLQAQVARDGAPAATGNQESNALAGRRSCENRPPAGRPVGMASLRRNQGKRAAKAASTALRRSLP